MPILTSFSKPRIRFSKRASSCCERASARSIRASARSIRASARSMRASARFAWASIRSMRASARFARSSAAAWLAATAARMASIFWKRRSTSCSISFSSLATYLPQRHQRLAHLGNDFPVLLRRRFGQKDLETLAGMYPVSRHLVDQPEIQLSLHQIGIELHRFFEVAARAHGILPLYGNESQAVVRRGVGRISGHDPPEHALGVGDAPFFQ